MKKIILIGILFLGLVLFMNGCGDSNTQEKTEVYIEDYRVEPPIVIPEEVFNIIYNIKNPTSSDRELFLEIDISQDIDKVNAPYNRISIGEVKSKTTKSFFNKFKVSESENIQKITLKLFSTMNSNEPINTQEIPIEVAINAR